MLPERQWLVEVRCPHGFRVLVGFEDLGYLMRPKDSVCDEHLAREAAREEKKLTEGWNRPTWYRLWRETRKARKALKEEPPWLSK